MGSIETNSNFRNFVPRFPLLIHGSSQPSAFIYFLKFLHNNFTHGPIASPSLLVRATLGFLKFEPLKEWFETWSFSLPWAPWENGFVPFVNLKKMYNVRAS